MQREKLYYNCILNFDTRFYNVALRPMTYAYNKNTNNAGIHGDVRYNKWGQII
jgi:hypothetical protein